MLNSTLFYLLVSGVTSACLYITYIKIKQLQQSLAYLQEAQQHYTIVIIKPSIIPAVGDLARAFTTYMKKYASFEFETIDCVHNLNRDKAQEWVEYAIDCDADLIVAVGLLSSEVAFNSMKMQHHKIPTIAVGSPTGYSAAPVEIMQAATPLTAISSSMKWERKTALLHRLLPRVKNVLIIFRSVDEISHTNLREKNAITASLRKMHISWRMHHVTNIDKSTDLNAQLLEDIDIIILSRSSEILRYSARVAREAQQFNVPVFSSDIACSDVFIGISECPERTMGIQAAKYAIEILEDKAAASSLPLKEINSDTVIVVHPQIASPITAAMVIGNLLNQSNHVALALTSATEHGATEKR